MDLLIAIMLWLGLIQPGTYTHRQIDARINSASVQISAVQSDPLLYNQAQGTNTSGVIIIEDPLENE